jgi:hypothetical protein
MHVQIETLSPMYHELDRFVMRELWRLFDYRGCANMLGNCSQPEIPRDRVRSQSESFRF